MNTILLRDIVERAVKTAAQSVLLAIAGATGADLFTLDWQTIGMAALGGALLSVLTSIVSLPFGPAGSPSVVATVEPARVVSTPKPKGL
jgi:hypothetical protein